MINFSTDSLKISYAQIKPDFFFPVTYLKSDFHKIYFFAKNLSLLNHIRLKIKISH